jgi:cell division protein FtsQ
MELEGVQIQGLEVVKAAEILERARLRKGMNLLEMDLGSLTRSVLEHPRIKTVTFKKVYPSRVEISLEERKPFVQIYSPGRDLYFLADEEGFILPEPRQRPFKGFLVYADDSVRPVPKTAGGQYRSERLAELYDFLKDPETRSLIAEEKIRKAAVNEIGFWTFSTEEGMDFLVGEELGHLKRLEDVKALLEAEPREKIDYLDLRFKDVIVRLKGKK